ncbi:hypothetical protein BMS3Bbin01_02437 [bacterium BMS3Bbin01]|nr:hypothetical protein BMS3Bbin01_02437 [bacterium BMS3Bbin01]
MGPFHLVAIWVLTGLSFGCHFECFAWSAAFLEIFKSGAHRFVPWLSAGRLEGY